MLDKSHMPSLLMALKPVCGEASVADLSKQKIMNIITFIHWKIAVIFTFRCSFKYHMFVILQKPELKEIIMTCIHSTNA